MDFPNHDLRALFAQLGLGNEPAAIDNFIASHFPLSPEIRLADADFWTPAQAGFLREELLEDADWAEVIDEFDARLRA